jgi:protein-disulfide reductase (glutathione)
VFEIRYLVIAPDFAYGAQGYADLIPPQSTLAFKIELINLVDGEGSASGGEGSASGNGAYESELDAAGFPRLRFGQQIKWFEYEDGLREAKKSNKPSMLVFYNDYCQFSSFMIKQIHESQTVIDLSKKFAMIKIGEDKLATVKDKERFDLDGTYTPKILFMDPDQNIFPDINNTDTAYPQTLYYYGDAATIENAMSAAIKRINITLGNGFGEYIDWVAYDAAFEVAAEEKKPMMMIIHKTWCGACAALKPKVEWSRPIWELSKYFVMVNVEDDAEPLDNQYFVDGGYYPRIFFLDSQGKVDRSLHNRDPAFLKHKYSYATEEHILMTMQFATHKYTGHLRRQESQQQYQQKQLLQYV